MTTTTTRALPWLKWKHFCNHSLHHDRVLTDKIERKQQKKLPSSSEKLTDFFENKKLDAEMKLAWILTFWRAVEMT